MYVVMCHNCNRGITYIRQLAQSLTMALGIADAACGFVQQLDWGTGTDSYNKHAQLQHQAPPAPALSSWAYNQCSPH